MIDSNRAYTGSKVLARVGKILTAFLLLLAYGTAPSLADGLSEASGKSGNSASPPDESSGLDEIVVTAQKRSERLQDVPMSISAFNGNALSKLNVIDTASLSRIAPSLSFTNSFAGGSGEPQLVLRGLSTAFGLSPVVSVYVDQTPMDLRTDIAAGATMIDFFDLDRIEVLRGPQGTIFGSSSLAGAIRIITAKPDPTKVTAAVDMSSWTTDGGSGSYSAKGSLNLPLSSNVAVRLVATDTSEGGWIDRITTTDYLNLSANAPITKINENTSHTQNVRLALQWQATDKLTITPTFIYTHLGFENLSLYKQQLGPFLRPHVSDDTGSFNTNIGSLVLEQQFDQFTLTSSTSYLWKDTYTVLDLSELGEAYALAFGLPAAAEPMPTELNVRYGEFAQEVRATSSGSGRLRWIAGAYFNRTYQKNEEIMHSNQFDSVFGPVGVVSYYSAPVVDRQIAGFGEVTYGVTDKLDVAAGLRVYQLKEEQGEFTSGPLTTNLAHEAESQSSGVSPRATLTYKPNAELMLYTTYSEGFRQGGPNTGIDPTVLTCTFIDVYNPSYEPDKSQNYEIGVKTTPVPSTSINVAAYQLTWKNFQAAIQSSCGPFVVNLGEARTRGVELDVQSKLSGYFSVYGGGSFNDGKITEVDPRFAQAGVGVPGQELINSPRYQFNLGGEAVLPLKNASHVFLRINYQYTGTSPTSYTSNDPLSIRPTYRNVDANLGWSDGRWDLELFSRNLTNTLQIQAINTGLLVGQDYSPGRPRTVGVQFRYSYN